MISFKRIIQISVPLVIGGLATNLVNLTDTLFMAKLGAVELGSTGNGSIFYFIVAYVGMGLTSGMQILIARRNGEDRRPEINFLLQAGLVSILCYSLLGIGAIWLGMKALLPLIFKSELIAARSYEYLSVRAFGLFFTLLTFAMSAFFVGITRTKVISWVVPLAAGLNILLDYLLIFGVGPFPEMGIKGAALASVISEASGAILLFVIAIISFRRSEIGLFKKFDVRLSHLKAILHLSAPLLIQNFITLGAWFVFFSLIEQLGENELAVSHILRSIYGLLMLPSFALGDAINSLVSNLIGARKESEVFSLIGKGILIGFVFNFLIAIINIGFEDQILGAFTQDTAILGVRGNSFLIINLALFILTLAMILFRSLTGTGRTRISLALELVSVSIYLSYAFWVVESPYSSLDLIWASEFVYFGLIALFSFLFLRFGTWKNRAI